MVFVILSPTSTYLCVVCFPITISRINSLYIRRKFEPSDVEESLRVAFQLQTDALKSTGDSSRSDGGGGGAAAAAKSLFKFDSKPEEDKKSEEKTVQNAFAKKLLSAIDNINQVADIAIPYSEPAPVTPTLDITLV